MLLNICIYLSFVSCAQ